MNIDTPERPEPLVPGLIKLSNPDLYNYISTTAAQSRIYRVNHPDRIDHLD
jgi:hypothetical protein